MATPRNIGKPAAKAAVKKPAAKFAPGAGEDFLDQMLRSGGAAGFGMIPGGPGGQVLKEAATPRPPAAAPSQPQIPPPAFLPDAGAGGPGVDPGLLRQAEAAQGQLKGLQQRQFANTEADIKADLARQAQSVANQRLQVKQDVLQGMADVRRELPETVARFRGGSAARGVTAGGRVDAQEQDIRNEASRQIADLDKQYQRHVKSGEWEKASANIAAQRELRNLQMAREERQAQERLQEAQEKAQAQAEAARSANAAAKQRQGEAKSWIGSRVNELVRSGVPEAQAQSRAIAEARSNYTEVPDTYLSGALKPSKAEKAKSDPVQKKWGVPISVERAGQISRKKQDEIRSRPSYRAGRKLADSFMRQAGGNGDVNGFVNFYADSLKANNPDATADQIRADVRKNAHILSMLAAEAGIR